MSSMGCRGCVKQSMFQWQVVIKWSSLMGSSLFGTMSDPSSAAICKVSSSKPDSLVYKSMDPEVCLIRTRYATHTTKYKAESVLVGSKCLRTYWCRGSTGH